MRRFLCYLKSIALVAVLMKYQHSIFEQEKKNVAQKVLRICVKMACKIGQNKRSLLHHPNNIMLKEMLEISLRGPPECSQSHMVNVKTVHIF